MGLTTERADRAAISGQEAAPELRRLASQGALAQRATDAALSAAGHGKPPAPAASRRQQAGGLSRREVEVPHFAAKGLTTQHIAERLFISPKTADNHIQLRSTPGGENPLAAETGIAASLDARQFDKTVHRS